MVGGVLRAGHNDFSARGMPRFTLGSSQDQGSTFQGEMNVCEAALPSCAPTSLTERVCRITLDEAGGFAEDYLEGERCAPDSPAGRSVPEKPGEASACSATPGATRSVGALVLAALLTIITFMRRAQVRKA
jgi:hypothetical protein